MTNRRAFLTGLTGFVACAPAIVRASSLMAMPRAPLTSPRRALLMRMVEANNAQLDLLRYGVTAWRQNGADLTRIDPRDIYVWEPRA